MRWAAGIIISLIFLFLSFQGISWKQLTTTFGEISYWPLLPMIGSIVFFFIFKALRWQLLLAPFADVPLKTLYPSIVMGTAVNYLFFGYLGEFLRIHLLGKERSIKKSSLLSSIVLERTFDLWTLLFFLGLASLISPQQTLQIAGFSAAGLGLAATIFAAGTVVKPQWFLKAVRFVPQKWRGVAEKEMESFIQGFGSIAHFWLLSGIIILSVGQWVFMCVCNWLAVKMVGIEVPPWALLGPMGLIILGMSLPSAPAQIGVIELCYIVGLSVWGVSKEAALSAGLIYHGVLYFSVFLAAIVFSRKLVWKGK